MGLVQDLTAMFKNRISPDMLRSPRFWAIALKLSQSPLIRSGLLSDVISTNFAVEMAREAYLADGPVVWANLLFPCEIIYGAGATPFYPEIAAAVIASTGLSNRFLEAAEAAGFSRDICAFHRTTIGAALQGFLPRPGLMLSSSFLCDSAPLTFSFMEELYDAEHITVDLPFESSDEEQVGYLSEILRHVASEIVKIAGVPNPDGRGSMRDAIILSNHARKHMLRVEELRKTSNGPLRGWDALGQVAALAMMPGTATGVDFYRTLAEDISGQSGSEVDGSDRHRLLWMHLKPFYNNDMGEFLSEKGADIVCEEYNRCYWREMDPDEPYRSLARKMSANISIGPADQRAAKIVRLALEYEVDAAVHYSHRGCRQSCGGAGLVRDELLKVGIRTLILDGECVDPGEFREGQTKTRIEAFLETL